MTMASRHTSSILHIEKRNYVAYDVIRMNLVLFRLILPPPYILTVVLRKSELGKSEESREMQLSSDHGSSLSPQQIPLETSPKLILQEELLLPRCLYGDAQFTRTGFGRLLQVAWSTGSWKQALQSELLVSLNSVPGPILMECGSAPHPLMPCWHLHWIETCLSADWRSLWKTRNNTIPNEVIVGQRDLVLDGMKYWWFAIAIFPISHYGPTGVIPAFLQLNQSDTAYYNKIIELMLPYCSLIQSLMPRLAWQFSDHINFYQNEIENSSWAGLWGTFFRLVFTTVLGVPMGTNLSEEIRLINVMYNRDVVSWLRTEVLTENCPFPHNFILEFPKLSEPSPKRFPLNIDTQSTTPWPLWSGQLSVSLDNTPNCRSELSLQLVSFHCYNQLEIAQAIRNFLPHRNCFVCPVSNNWITVLDYDLDVREVPRIRETISPNHYCHELAKTVCSHCACSALLYDFELPLPQCWIYNTSGQIVESVPNNNRLDRICNYTLDIRNLLMKYFCFDGYLPSFNCLERTDPRLGIFDHQYVQNDIVLIIQALNIPYIRLSYGQLLRLSSFLNDKVLPRWSQFIHVGQDFQCNDLW